MGCNNGTQRKIPTITPHETIKPPLTWSQTILSEPAVSEVNLYLQVHSLIRATGQFVDEVSARYFQGVHHHLPVISRTRFNSSLVTLGSTPSASFSVLLLSICLVTSSPELGRASGSATRTQQVDRRSLHLATRSLLAQAQAVFPPSLHLVQAGLLLSLYEFAYGCPDMALATIAGCARMGYAARIHVHIRPPQQAPGSLKTDVATDRGTDYWLRNEEAANTWWGVVICER